MQNFLEEQPQHGLTATRDAYTPTQINELVAFLMQNGIMPTVQLNQQPNGNMTYSPQLSSLDAHCRDSFAEQKAKVQQLAEISARHESKLDALLKDTAVLKVQVSEHLAKRTDLLGLSNDMQSMEASLRSDMQSMELRVIQKINDEVSGVENRLGGRIDKLEAKVDDHFKWMIGGFLTSAVVICGAMFALTDWKITKVENDLRAGIESNKAAIVEVRQEMKANHEEVSKQLTEIRLMLQEKQSSASIK